MNSPDLVVTQVTVSAVIVWIIQRLKSAEWFPWMTGETWWVNRVVSALLAFVAAIGIQFQFSAEAGTLLISGLSATNLMGITFDWLRSFVFQQVIYKTTTKG